MRAREDHSVPSFHAAHEISGRCTLTSRPYTESQAWQQCRDVAGGKIEWRFGTEDVSTKLERTQTGATAGHQERLLLYARFYLPGCG